jgi:hypothetical protein
MNTMDERTLTKEINKVLQFNWSKKQIYEGKKIEVRWEWGNVLARVVGKYRECGWVVEQHIELSIKGRDIFLVFINPNWKKNQKRELPV